MSFRQSAASIGSKPWCRLCNAFGEQKGRLAMKQGVNISQTYEKYGSWQNLYSNR